MNVILLIRKKLLDIVGKWNGVYVFYREIKLRRKLKKTLLKIAVKSFEEEKPEHGNLRDYKKKLRWYIISYKEYLVFEYWKLDKKKNLDYLLEGEMVNIYRKTVQASAIISLANKVYSLKALHKYVHRRWVYPNNASFEEFAELVSSADCIAKPYAGSLGNGIFRIMKDEEKDLQGLYARCREENLVVEEYVRACEELEAFHPQSLNTIRVFTISKGSKCELVAAELRMGVGDHFVDNASLGGIVAPVDLDSGIILMDGMDKSGNRYATHPDSGKTIKGFVIPHWDKVVQACKEMTGLIPDVTFAGWDMSVLRSGEVEMIEVNSTPNVMGLQLAYRKGLKPRLQKVGMEVLGYDPLKLISIWSRSHVNYADRKRQLQEKETS